jgi:hypothetical protein
VPTFWLNCVFAGEAQIWNLGCVTKRLFFSSNKKFIVSGFMVK